MPEIKHVFSQGKMNKDLDERLVPNGQYRDANNIQVTTSESNDAGTVQSLLGNSAIPVASATTISTAGICVGSISDEKNNAAYWLVASSNDWSNSIPSSTLTYKDVIYKTEYNSTSNTHTTTPVFIDFWLEKQPVPTDWDGDNDSFSGASKDLGGTATANLSVGMYIRFVEQDTSEWRIITDITGTTVTWNSVYSFTAGYNPKWIEFTWYEPEHYGVNAYGNGQFKNRVLRFDKNYLITGLNIIDDLLFWTDNNSEPKKINVKRSIAGTDSSNLNKSTRCVVEDRSIAIGDDVFVKEQDITVIKKNPIVSPFLQLNTGVRSGQITTTTTSNFDGIDIGETIDFLTADVTDYISNDKIIFSTTSGTHVTARVKTINDVNVSVIVLTKKSDTPSGSSLFNLSLQENAQNLYEEKFARIATRWKYIDGEYSTISPFSEAAFVPGSFGYDTTTCFNVGMVNQLKELIIKDFVPSNIPSEVVEVEILYKESDSPIIYSIDAVKNKDISTSGGANQWNHVNDSLVATGRYKITSEKINSIIPSNQILRPFDVVPRTALAQSVVGNRLVYGNYLQNFNLINDAGNTVKPKINPFINFRNGLFPELLTNNLASPEGATTNTDCVGWGVDISWSLRDFGIGTNLRGGFKNAFSTGVVRFDKLHQDIVFEDETRYRVKIKVLNYVQGEIRISLIGPNFYAEKDVNSDGDHDIEFFLDTPNTNSVNSLYASNKTFVIQSLNVNNNWIGEISNFSCKKIINNDKKSIKSQRTYQVGVVYADEFGRQTPVLTDETASMKVGKSQSSKENAINVKLENSPPDFAYSFKFFVKETSSPYHNLAVDRVYNSFDGNVWLAFPSSERNKVDEETYLVLKKEINTDYPVISESSTYKVLSIKNEAPAYIKLSQKQLGTSSSDLNNLFTDSNYRPSEGQSVLAIKKDSWIQSENGAALEGLNNVLIRFFDGDAQKTAWKKVDSVTVNDVSGVDFYFLHLNRSITEFDASWIMNGSLINSQINISIVREETVDRPELDGKFFVKIAKDSDIESFVLTQAQADTVVARSDVFYSSDDVVVGVNYGTATRYQKDSDSTNGTTTGDNDVRVFTKESKIHDADPSQTGGYTRGNSGGLKYPFTINTSGEYFDESGDSGYSPARGTLESTGVSNKYILVMSKYAVAKWGRILRFLQGANQYNNPPLNEDASRNFFIDQVRYVGTQPLNENDPAKGIYQSPGYWDHQFNGLTINGARVTSSFQSPSRFGKGIFKADTSDAASDPFFESEKTYMEISYSKINASSSLLDIEAKDVSTPASYNNAWSVGQSNNTSNSDEKLFVSKLRVGSQFRFTGDPANNIYKIKKLRQEKRYNHTPYPLTSQDNVIAQAASQSSNSTKSKTYIRPSLLQTGNLVDYKFTTTDAGGELKAPFNAISGNSDQTNDFSNVVVDAGATLDKELNFFGRATNRRLTWVVEIEDINGKSPLDVGVYNPLNTTNSVNSDLMCEDFSQFIEFLEASIENEDQLISPNPAIFETKPKTDEGLDIYYEASNFISVGKHNSFHELPWFNCYSFGNGVESNRIKDDFNQVFVDKNAIVSTTFEGEYKEDRRRYGLIYSGLYNNTTSVNNLNQFIIAEKITKEINPEYGSIQKLHARNSDLVTLCEDKVLRILSKKDALFNADGNTNLTATSNVLGQTIPFAGDYGISNNPESFAVDSYRVYFTDKQRGAVLRLSMDGLTPISDYGMKDYFKDNLKPATNILGSYDASKDEYNVTIKASSNTTVSYSEQVKGWSSFKSFIPQEALSVANNYYSFANQSGNAKVWWHHKNNDTSNFYGTQYFSDITLLLNDAPSAIKTFKTLSYEGTQSKVDANTGDGDYYNLTAVNGWQALQITTDKQSGSINEFIEKEGKWFNFLKGDATTLSNLDTGEFTVQGLGVISSHTTAN